MFSINLAAAALLGTLAVGQKEGNAAPAPAPVKKEGNAAPAPVKNAGDPAQPAVKKKEGDAPQAVDKKKKANLAAAGTSGVVDRVDAGAKTITLKAGKNGQGGITVAIDDQTKFTLQDGNETRQVQFADVAAGRNVTIVHETKDGKELAKSVTIVAAKKK